MSFPIGSYVGFALISRVEVLTSGYADPGFEDTGFTGISFLLVGEGRVIGAVGVVAGDAVRPGAFLRTLIR